MGESGFGPGRTEQGDDAAEAPRAAPGRGPEIPEVLRGPSESERRLASRLVPKTARPEMQAIGLGFEFLGMAGGGCLLGVAADLLLGSAPTGLIVGALLGIALAGYHTTKQAMKLGRDLDAQSEQRTHTRSGSAGRGAGSGSDRAG